MFKRTRPVTVKVYEMEQLGKLLDWLRQDEGLSRLNRSQYTVVANIGMRYWDDSDRVRWFEVEIPHHRYQKLKDEFFRKQGTEEQLQQKILSSF